MAFMPHREVYDSRLNSQAVAALWFVCSPTGNMIEHRFLPDGCMDLIVRARVRDGVIVETFLFVAGPALLGQCVPIDGDAVYAGIRFRPAWGAVCLRLDARETAESIVSEQALPRALDKIRDHLAAMTNPAQLLAALAETAGRLSEGRASYWRPDAAVDLIQQGRLSLQEVARRLCLSERALRREVLAATGLSPKALCSIARVRKAVQALGDSGRSLAEVADMCGYSDQSHMTRDFQRMAKRTPNQIRAKYLAEIF